MLQTECIFIVHNEIHKAQKPSEALPSQVVAKVTKGQRAKGKGRILFLDQTTKDN